MKVQRTERISRIIDLSLGPRILDVGCADHEPRFDSPHWLHGQLRIHFSDVTGVESDPDLVKALSTAGYSNIHQGNAENMNFPEKFNTIVAGELIEHLTEPAAFLRNARTLLCPGGRVVLSTPYAFGLIHMAYAYLRFPKTCPNAQHVFLFCPSTLAGLFARCGFRVIHWELAEDYRYEKAEDHTIAFRAFIIFIRLFRYVIPKRARSTSMIFVAEAM